MGCRKKMELGPGDRDKEKKDNKYIKNFFWWGLTWMDDNNLPSN